jgi:hypothetical protein
MSKSWCSPVRRQQPTKAPGWLRCAPAVVCLLLFVALIATREVMASSDSPPWLRALVNVPLPAHDEKTDAVKLYSETIVSVQSVDKIRTQVRIAYKILRPGGRDLGTPVISYNASFCWSCPMAAS